MALPRLRQLLRPTVAQQSPAPSEQSSGPPVEADDSWGGFPPARYFAILGELPENYRGTATVALHRSCMIAAQTGRPLEILTLGHTVDYEALTREMRSDGRLTELVRFRNMWTDLATMHPERARPSKGAFEAFAPLDESTTTETLAAPGVPLRRFRQDGEGKNLQIDLCRADGTIIVSDRRDAEPTKKRGNRSIILCDTAGRPVRELGSINALRRYWLDQVVGDDTAVIFSDTFGVAGLMHTYRRANVTVVQTFHNQHLVKGSTRLLDNTEKRYLPFIDNVDGFDATVFLTERQRDEIAELLGPGPTRFVVPNSRELPSPEQVAVGTRDPDAVVMVGGLIPGKQVDHGIRAVVDAGNQLDSALTLRVYGDGVSRPDLERLVDEIGTDTITFAGHDPSAPAAFSTASVTLLTSRSEAFPLVLIESMARGCIPVAYDIRYGPRDIITDGVDGFLVPPGDVEAVTEALVRIRRMSESEREQLRANAVRRAQEFSDAAVGPRWAEVVRSAMAAKVPPLPLEIVEQSTSVETSDAGLDVFVRIRTDRPVQEPRVHLTIWGRAEPVRLRRPAEILRSSDRTLEVRATVAADHVEWVKGTILDAYLEIHDAAGRTRRRLPAPAAQGGPARRVGGFEAYPTAHGNLSLKKVTPPRPSEP